ncbi:hypothetical protein [Sedimenticola sp.]|uniref:hypothetical protein n=1 Tax=Sedimenticola sp. TaxID=1940285 RepID=UPI003D0A4F92
MLHENILNIRDESGLGSVYHELQLSFEKSRVTVKDIITERVIQEVALYNRKASEYRHALVEPSDTEAMLNRATKGKRRPIDTQKQIDIAIQAFSGNGFFILVDDQQVETLEQIVEITPHTRVSFVKLVPLVGG